MPAETTDSDYNSALIYLVADLIVLPLVSRGENYVDFIEPRAQYKTIAANFGNDVELMPFEHYISHVGNRLKDARKRCMFFSLSSSEDYTGYRDIISGMHENLELVEGRYVPESERSIAGKLENIVDYNLKKEMMKYILNDFGFLLGAEFFVTYCENLNPDNYDKFMSDALECKSRKNMDVSLWLQSDFNQKELRMPYDLVMDKFFDRVIIYDSRKFGFVLDRENMPEPDGFFINPVDFYSDSRRKLISSLAHLPN